ncbi:MAG: alpha-glucosidase/alpha-galactosidase [Bacilli bacterium]|nr:alpha-glucosidase/alpha-galactosidase [Bacilli bacterium]MBN2696396.1 alpha-glucosidase/alpha-galactosidase [Bacilli bacterium]
MKITFLGAGSTVFAKNVLGDCIINPQLKNMTISLYDIDHERLDDSFRMLTNLNRTMGGNATIVKEVNRKKALQDANYIVNAIQVGGYDPATILDFEIPKKYGFRQTIGDTMSIGGIFRALRTIPVLEEFASDIEEVCPDALFINYVNPMSILTGYMQRYTKVNTVGLCHSVQICVPRLLKMYGLEAYTDKCRYQIAGINHMAWLLSLEGTDGFLLYDEIKRRNLENDGRYNDRKDLVRLEIMRRFGYYVTESSEHNAEYMPYFIKQNYPEFIEKYNIPLDEYPRRCVNQINEWKHTREQLTNNPELRHEKSYEYASSIIEAMETDKPFKMNGNVLNKGLITNLPEDACVEVLCLVDRAGIHPTYVGQLPTALAALNMTNVNVQLMTIEAARTRKRSDVYKAAYLDPRLSAELSMDEIKSMCDELFEAEKEWLGKYN